MTLLKWYRIKNNRKGFYFHLKFEGVGKTIQELEKIENIDDSLIRYLTVKVKNLDLDTNYFAKKEDTIKSEKKEKTTN